MEEAVRSALKSASPCPKQVGTAHAVINVLNIIGNFIRVVSHYSHMDCFTITGIYSADESLHAKLSMER